MGVISPVGQILEMNVEIDQLIGNMIQLNKLGKDITQLYSIEINNRRIGRLSNSQIFSEKNNLEVFNFLEGKVKQLNDYLFSLQDPC